MDSATKAYCVVEFAITENQTAVQRAYRKHFNLGRHGKVPSLRSIKRWLAEYREGGTIARKKKGSTIDDYVHRLEKCLEVNGQSVE